MLGRAHACGNRSGVITDHLDGQCECKVEDAFYPVGVELMQMKMEIGYRTSPKFGVGGSSNVPAGSTDDATGDNPLHVVVLNQTGHNVIPDYESGGAVGLTVAEWLKAAGVSLEDEARHTPDYTYHDDRCAAHGTCGLPMRYPRFRTAGVMVNVMARFHNTEDQVQTLAMRWDALWHPQAVSAEITADANKKVWAGLGAVTFYETTPHGPDQMAYHKVERRATHSARVPVGVQCYSAPSTTQTSTPHGVCVLHACHRWSATGRASSSTSTAWAPSSPSTCRWWSRCSWRSSRCSRARRCSPT